MQRVDNKEPQQGSKKGQKERERKGDAQIPGLNLEDGPGWCSLPLPAPAQIGLRTKFELGDKFFFSPRFIRHPLPLLRMQAAPWTRAPNGAKLSPQQTQVDQWQMATSKCHLTQSAAERIPKARCHMPNVTVLSFARARIS